MRKNIFETAERLDVGDEDEGNFFFSAWVERVE